MRYPLLCVVIIHWGIVFRSPVVVGVGLVVWLTLTITKGRTARCPACGVAKMRCVGGIKEAYPSGKGTGWSYLCEQRGQRWWWSNDRRAWEDASAHSAEGQGGKEGGKVTRFLTKRAGYFFHKNHQSSDFVS
jgi:hypothetical protein